MRVDGLMPTPGDHVAFQRNKLAFIPSISGCYALTTFSQVILYVGLAKDLRRRCDQHLDSESKVKATNLGRAIFFYWLPTTDYEVVERTWMNIHIQSEGELPVLNRMYSPTRT